MAEEIAHSSENPGKSIFAAVIGALAGILMAAIGAWATIHSEQIKLEAERKQKEQAQNQIVQYVKMYENAPQKFTRELGRQIDAVPKFVPASKESLGNAGEVVDHARAIVKSRNDLRSPLEGIGSRLDTEIDELEKELSKPNPDPEKIAHSIEVLHLSWPAKQQEIELRVRTLLDVMGISQVSASTPAQGGGGGQTR
jgi:hypothetical protein